MYRLWGIGLIGAGLTIIAAFFGEATLSPAAIPSTEPIVILPLEPAWTWPGPSLQVGSVPPEETKRRGFALRLCPKGYEDTEDIVLLPPRALASSPLPQAPTTTQLGSSPLLGWPVSSGEITQGFGCSPYYTGLTGPGCPAETPWFHDGLDIGAVSGAPVRAAITGTVLFAGPDSSGPECGDYRGYGLAVVVDNGTGWQTLYAHLSQVQVSVGQVITPEAVIGQVGASGCVSGPHLHFGLRHKGELVDPAEVGSKE